MELVLVWPRSSVVLSVYFISNIINVVLYFYFIHYFSVVAISLKHCSSVLPHIGKSRIFCFGPKSIICITSITTSNWSIKKWLMHVNCFKSLHRAPLINRVIVVRNFWSARLRISIKVSSITIFGHPKAAGLKEKSKFFTVSLVLLWFFVQTAFAVNGFI